MTKSSCFCFQFWTKKTWLAEICSKGHIPR